MYAWGGRRIVWNRAGRLDLGRIILMYVWGGRRIVWNRAGRLDLGRILIRTSFLRETSGGTCSDVLNSSRMT